MCKKSTCQNCRKLPNFTLSPTLFFSNAVALGPIAQRPYTIASLSHSSESPYRTSLPSPSIIPLSFSLPPKPPHRTTQTSPPPPSPIHPLSRFFAPFKITRTQYNPSPPAPSFPSLHTPKQNNYCIPNLTNRKNNLVGLRQSHLHCHEQLPYGRMVHLLPKGGV